MWKEMTGQTIEQIVILIASEDGSTQEIVDNPINHVASLRQTIEDFRTLQSSGNFSSS